MTYHSPFHFVALAFVACVAALTFSQPVHADDMYLAVPPIAPTAIDRCRTVEATFKPIYIQTVALKQANEYIGLMRKKSDQAMRVFVQGDLKDVIRQTVANTLTACGFKLVSSSEGAITMSIAIDDFFIKTQNEGLVGKGEFVTQLTFNLSAAGEFSEITIGTESDLKTVPFGQKKRLEKLVTAAIKDLGNQLAVSDAFYESIQAKSALGE